MYGQSPEERAVCGDDPDLAPRCLEVSTNRDENGDARVVNLAQVTEVEHRDVGDCLFKQGLDRVGEFHGRRKPQRPRHAHDQGALTRLNAMWSPAEAASSSLPGTAFPGCAEGALGLLLVRGGVVAHWLPFVGWGYRRGRRGGSRAITRRTTELVDEFRLRIAHRGQDDPRGEQQVSYLGDRQGVDHLGALASLDHQSGLAEHRQLL